MTPEQAWQKIGAASDLRDEVRKAFPCEECDGIGEKYPGHVWHPCLECQGTGFHIPEEEGE